MICGMRVLSFSLSAFLLLLEYSGPIACTLVLRIVTSHVMSSGTTRRLASCIGPCTRAVRVDAASGSSSSTPESRAHARKQNIGSLDYIRTPGRGNADDEVRIRRSGRSGSASAEGRSTSRQISSDWTAPASPRLFMSPGAFHLSISVSSLNHGSPNAEEEMDDLNRAHKAIKTAFHVAQSLMRHPSAEAPGILCTPGGK